MWSSRISIVLRKTGGLTTLLLAVLLAGVAIPAAGAQSTTDHTNVQPTPPTDSAEAHYWLRVTADRVNVRSRGDLNSRIVGRVGRDDVLEAVGSEYEWHQIAPSAGVFSIVAAQYVERVSPGRGIVKVDTTLRVRVGSDVQRRDPLLSEVQTRLERDAEVQIIGQLDDQWLKIVPPAGVYVYVSADFVERISVAVADRLRAAKASAGSQPAVAAAAPPPGAATTTRPTDQPDLTGRWGRQLGRTVGLIEAEQRKPVSEQAWGAILDSLRPIKAQREEPQVARLAAAWAGRIDRRVKAQVAAQAAGEVAGQAERDKARYARELEELRRAKELLEQGPEFAARGVLRASFALGPGPYGLRYKLQDPFTHEVRAYVEFPPKLGIDVGACLGKYVGVRGERRSEEGVGVSILRVTHVTVLNPDGPTSRPAREKP